MPVWKRTKSGLSSLMRGIREKIQSTKTKLLRRDSKDSADEASSLHPVKTAKASHGSWGRRSLRRHGPSTSNHSLNNTSNTNLNNNADAITAAAATTNIKDDNIVAGESLHPSAVTSSTNDTNRLVKGDDSSVRNHININNSNNHSNNNKNDDHSDKLADANAANHSKIIASTTPSSSSSSSFGGDNTNATANRQHNTTDQGQGQGQERVGTIAKATQPHHHHQQQQPPQLDPSTLFPPSLPPHHTSSPHPSSSSSLSSSSPSPQPQQSLTPPLTSSQNPSHPSVSPKPASPLSFSPPPSASRSLPVGPIPKVIVQKDSQNLQSAQSVDSNTKGDSPCHNQQHPQLDPPAAASTNPQATESLELPSKGLSQTEPALPYSGEASLHSPVASFRLKSPERPYRLSQYPTDSSGLLTDTDSSSLNRLRQNSSRTTLSVQDNLYPDSAENLDKDDSCRDFADSSYAQKFSSSEISNHQDFHSTVAQLVRPEIDRQFSIDDPVPTLDAYLGSLETLKTGNPVSPTLPKSRRKDAPSFPRRQSLINPLDTSLLQSLVEHESSPIYPRDTQSIVSIPQPSVVSYEDQPMRNRRIWVKRPGGSPTQVIVAEDDYVDNLRDLCLRKYANALGRTFDSPDLMIRIVPTSKPSSNRTRRDVNPKSQAERILAPDENLSVILDDYYPTGQSSDDALLIDIPQLGAMTPRPSPGPHSLSYLYGQRLDSQEVTHEGGYFPPQPVMSTLGHSQNGGPNRVYNINGAGTAALTHLTSPPPLSPGPQTRPKVVRTQTQVSSPISAVSSTQGIATLRGNPDRLPRGLSEVPPSPSALSIMAPLPSPGHEELPNKIPEHGTNSIATPSDAHKAVIPSKAKEPVPVSTGTLDGQVPAINVLIVEDNIINLKLLEAFMKRLKVRWQSAMNGRDAVTKWRTGGFQLVLMDIQLPIMNGLDATKEIRRLERLNGIGSFSSNPSIETEPVSDADVLDKSLVFKGSVIIVALTASSLESDRHEALAVGCNDFLTKPVNFTYLERKVMEWGCMQALIDFDGWRKWRDLATKFNAAGKKGAAPARRGKAAIKAKDRANFDDIVPSEEP